MAKRSESSIVYYASARATRWDYKYSLIARLEDLIQRAGSDRRSGGYRFADGASVSPMLPRKGPGCSNLSEVMAAAKRQASSGSAVSRRPR